MLRGRIPGDLTKLTPVVFVLTLVGYGATVLLFGTFRSPDAAYYPALAGAFLEHRFDVDPPAAGTGDLSHFGGKLYVPFPPLPALLMLPQAALFGHLSISSVFYGVVLGSLGVSFVFLILVGLVRKSLLSLSSATIGWLTAAFAFGTVNWYMSLAGSVWFLAQITACAMCTLALVFAVWLPVRWAPLAAGVAVAAGITARPSVAPYVVAVIAITWLRLTREGTPQPGRSAHRAPTTSGCVRLALFTLVPALAAICVLAAYNYVRFASPSEFGYSAGFQDVDPSLVAPLAKYGQFSPVYTPQNLWAALFSGFKWDGTLLGFRPDPRGMSMLLTTPVLIYLWRARGRTGLTVTTWATIALILIPLLMYYNTGWNQFGYRFSLDFLPLVFILLGVAFAGGISHGAKLLISLGVLMNLVGAAWFLSITT